MSFYKIRVFPFLNDKLTRLLSSHRREILSDAAGEVLELGFGSGSSLGSYPRSVSRVVGVEPNPGMVEKFSRRVPVETEPRARLLPISAEKLPFENQSFDHVVSFLTLCTVSDLAQVVSEMKRVLKPSGKVYLIEHLAQPRGTATRWVQDQIHPLWKSLACGCHTNRETFTFLEEAGFQLQSVKTIGYSGFPNFLSPMKQAVGKLG